MNIVDKAKAKRKEMDDIKNDNATLRGKGAKADGIGEAVKKLTQTEFNALPKALQKELKEYR